MQSRILVASLLGALLLMGTAQAQDKVGTTAAPFLTIGAGARALAMGGAQVAQAQGPSALYWNPSAVALSNTSAVELGRADWYVETSIQHAALTLNLGGAGVVGLSMVYLDYGTMYVTTVDAPEGTGEQFNPKDLSVGVSYARMLTDRFALGGTVKRVQQQIWKETASAVAIDLGVSYLSDFNNLRIGMSLTNFGTDMRMQGDDLRRAIDIAPNQNGNNDRLAAYLETDAWPLPLSFRVGLAMDAWSTASQRLTLTADAVAPSDNAQTANFGAEYVFRDLLMFRGGYRQAFVGTEVDGGWSVGAGLNFALGGQTSGYFDYAWQQHQVFDGTQVLSVGVTF